MARKKNMEAPPLPLGSRIRAIRKKKGVTQQELAEKLGVTQRVISYYENDRANLSFELIHRIARALDVSPKKLFGTEKAPDLEQETALSPALQKKFNQVAKLPYADQQYVIKTIDMLVYRNGLQC